jgi:hypothetical protein
MFDVDLDAAQMALLQRQETVALGVLSVKALLIVTHVMQQNMDVAQMV